MAPRRTTIKDIAIEAGVSIALVSFVMNNQANRNGEGNGKSYRVSEETTKRILEIARRLNYQPNNAARSLRRGRTNTIGVILSDISNKFFADIARCIEDRAYKHNFTVIFGSTDEDASKLHNLIDVFINKGVDGLIIVPCDGSEEDIRRLAETAIPLVLIDRNIEGAGISSVMLNNHKAAAMAVDELVANNHRHIEMVSYGMTISNIIEREAGYLQAMKQHELSKYAKINRLKFKDIHEKTETIVNETIMRGADALIFATNTLSIAGLKALDRNGMMVPDRVAVVGFDGSEAFDLYYTTLTYIKQPIEQFGVEALDLVIKIIREGDAQYTAITLNPELVTGRSSEQSDL